MNKKLRKLAFLNRQPSLFRHSCVGMEIVPAEDNDDETIGLSPLCLEPLNADFDGDTCALYILHDNKSLEEIHDKAFLQSHVTYDSSNQMLSTIRHEALYAAFVLSSSYNNTSFESIYIDKLNHLPEDIDLYNKVNTPIKFNDNLYPYGIVLLNKWCGFNHIIIDYEITKKQASQLSKIIYNYFNRNNKKFYDQLAELEKKLFFFISVFEESPTINLDDLLNVLPRDVENLYHKLPNNNPQIGYYIHKGLSERCINNLDHEQQLYKLFKSGSRFSRTQLERAVINVGYCANSENNVVAKSVNSNLISGLSEDDFFMGADGTRKAIADNAKSTPDSGFLERSLVMTLSPLEIIEEDCCTDSGLEITVMSKKHAEILEYKWYKDPNISNMPWTVLDYQTAKSYVNKNIIIRTPMTCLTGNYKLCRKCFGEKYFPTNYVGITAGQVLSERFTQLTLRTFHQSGSAELDERPELTDLIETHLIDIIYEDNYIVLEFDTTNFNYNFENLSSFDKIESNKVYFNGLHHNIQNNDTIVTLHKMKELLKIQRKNISTPYDYYQKMTALVLSVGTPYSSFIEMLFANMFATQVEPDLKLWRYNQSDPIIVKFGDKSLAVKLSKLLGLLYQPNSDTIEKLDQLRSIDLNNNKLTIHEKIFLENI